MKALTDTVISLCDLAEAEGRLLQQKLVQTFGVVLLMLMAAGLMMLASALFMLALYQFLIIYWTPPQTLFALGVACLLLAGAALWIALYTRRQP
ncbi:hypothetical protein [Thiothrix nivea]|uniref:Phage holin family protein n=1 Tax=Thiothrix nivea (strain ATCC 35100 / DSM 5205 / JP2) TaxID=870187 RepID=A0A656HK25_THINJ|nr:hypothetical protein [Thiothrix nivea]EIJ36444.1 hypothetical protein Thini_3944 [Thiothrix nivea DSM 5205]